MNEEMKQLRKDITMLKVEKNIKYKTMAEEMNMSYWTLTQFTSGTRPLPEAYVEKVRQYIKDKSN